MAGVTKQIIGSFEDIGKGIISESAKVVTDVGGKALESLGTPAGKGQGQKVQQGQKNQEDQKGPLGELEQTKDQKAKKAIARAALEQLSGKRPEPKELGVGEKLGKEKDQQQKAIKEQEEKLEKRTLKEPTLVPKRGNLLGVTKQKAGSETSRNVRQD